MRAEPCGKCWCGCGGVTGEGSFFMPGHDKVGESAVVLVEFGSVAQFLAAHGYGPDGKNARIALEEWRAKGNRAR